MSNRFPVSWLLPIFVAFVCLQVDTTTGQDVAATGDQMQLVTFSADRFALADHSGIRWRSWEPQLAQVSFNQQSYARSIELNTLNQWQTQSMPALQATPLDGVPMFLNQDYSYYNSRFKLSPDDAAFAIASPLKRDDDGNIISRSSTIYICSADDGKLSQSVAIDEPVIDFDFAGNRWLVLVTTHSVRVYQRNGNTLEFAAQHLMHLSSPIEYRSRIAFGGRHVAVRQDSVLEVYSLETGRLSNRFRTPNAGAQNPVSQALSADGRYLAACFSSTRPDSSGSLRGSEQFHLAVWDLASEKIILDQHGGYFDNGRVQARPEKPDGVLFWEVCFAPDSASVIAEGFYTGRCVQIDIASGEILQNFSPWDRSRVGEFSSEQEFTGAPGDFTRPAALRPGWNPKKLSKFSENGRSSVYFATDVWDGQLNLIVDGRESFSRFWLVKPGQNEPLIGADLPEPVTLRAASPHLLLFASNRRKQFYKLDLRSIQDTYQTMNHIVSTHDRHSETCLSVVFENGQPQISGIGRVDGIEFRIADGALLRTDATSNDRAFAVHDHPWWLTHNVETGDVAVRSSSLPIAAQFPSPIRGETIGISPSGTILAVADSDTIRSFECATGKLLNTMTLAREIAGLIPSDDGSVLVGYSNNEIFCYAITESVGACNVWEVMETTSRIQSVTIDPTGRLVAVGSDSGEINIWSLRSKTQLDWLKLPVESPALAMKFNQESSSLGILQAGWRMWEWGQPNTLEPLPSQFSDTVVDWSAPGHASAGVGSELTCEVLVGQVSIDQPSQVTLTIRVNNHGSVPYHRVWATVLVASKHSHPIIVPIGRVPAGETEKRKLTIDLDTNGKKIWVGRCTLRSGTNETVYGTQFKVDATK